jgi:hypothetical protein
MPASKPETPRESESHLNNCLFTLHITRREEHGEAERSDVRQPARHRRDIKFHKAFCARKKLCFSGMMHGARRKKKNLQAKFMLLCSIVFNMLRPPSSSSSREKQPICSFLSSVQLYQSTHQMHGAAAAAAAVSKLN